VQIQAQKRETEITLDSTKDEIVTAQAVTAGDTPAKDNWAYQIKAPRKSVVFIPMGVPFAPEFRDSNGEKLDGSTRVLFQKTDAQGNPISTHVLNELLSKFNYEQMRTDDDYFRYTQEDLMLDEREEALIFLDIPASANDFDPTTSTLTIGDNTSNLADPVEYIDYSDLGPEEVAAVKSASQKGGN
jgi:hypothetical protein